MWPSTPVWADRTSSAARPGLPLATYFSGPERSSGSWKNVSPASVRWLRPVKYCFGNIDTYLIWHLTGGPNGGIHVTDVSNASRTQLMNLENTCHGAPKSPRCSAFPMAMFAEDLLQQRSLRHGEGKQPWQAFPVAGDLGDQQAALVGQTCFKPGQAKNTYGTGCFLLLKHRHHTGSVGVRSSDHPGLQAGQRACGLCP